MGLCTFCSPALARQTGAAPRRAPGRPSRHPSSLSLQCPRHACGAARCAALGRPPRRVGGRRTTCTATAGATASGRSGRCWGPLAPSSASCTARAPYGRRRCTRCGGRGETDTPARGRRGARARSGARRLARARARFARDCKTNSRPPPRRRLPWRSAHRAGGLYCRARSLADDRLSASGLRAAEPSSLAFPNLFVSRSCAPLLWRRLDGAPSLGQDDAGTLHNIPKAVRRGRQLECTRCGERGATVRAARGAARRCAAPCRTGLQLTPCRTPCRASNGRPTG